VIAKSILEMHAAMGLDWPHFPNNGEEVPQWKLIEAERMIRLHSNMALQRADRLEAERMAAAVK
jgi:hypothetical protein